MAAVVAFDTLKVVERLELAGVPADQAKAQAAVWAEVIANEAQRYDERFVTKVDSTQEIVGLRNDVNASRFELRTDVNTLRQEVRADINALRLETKALVSDAKGELIRWVVTVGILQMALITGLVLRIVH